MKLRKPLYLRSYVPVGEASMELPRRQIMEIRRSPTNRDYAILIGPGMVQPVPRTYLRDPGVITDRRID